MSMAINILEKYRKDIVNASNEKYYSTLRNMIAVSPELDMISRATEDSLLNAFLMLARTQLYPDGKDAILKAIKQKNNNGHIYLASTKFMVSGILKLIFSNNQIKSIHVKTVYKDEKFSAYSDEFGDHLTYAPNYDVQRIEANIKLFYACAVLENSSVIIEVMTKRQVDDHKKLAKMPFIWNKWYSEMGIKTIIHRILKRLPSNEITSDIQKSLEDDLDLDLDLKKNEHTTKPPTPANEIYTEDDVKKNIKVWGDMIKKGTIDIDQIIVKIKTRRTLSDELEEFIRLTLNKKGQQ